MSENEKCYEITDQRNQFINKFHLIRYPDDAFDRIWGPFAGGSGLITVSNNASNINANTYDRPPVAVLTNAISIPTTTPFMPLSLNLPANEVAVYFNMYFTEMAQLSSTQKRSFQLYINNNSSPPLILPTYGGVTEVYFTNFTASSRTTFSLVATSDSTLPPLICAMEAFYLSSALVQGTNRNDGWYLYFRI